VSEPEKFYQRMIQIAEEREDRTLETFYIRRIEEFSTKNDADIPREIRRKYCGGCYTLRNGQTRTRLRPQKGNVNIRCTSCGSIKRISYKK
jgi:RNase P subunit RPR2